MGKTVAELEAELAEARRQASAGHGEVAAGFIDQVLAVLTMRPSSKGKEWVGGVLRAGAVTAGDGRVYDVQVMVTDVEETAELRGRQRR